MGGLITLREATGPDAPDCFAPVVEWRIYADQLEDAGNQACDLIRAACDVADEVPGAKRALFNGWQTVLFDEVRYVRDVHPFSPYEVEHGPYYAQLYSFKAAAAGSVMLPDRGQLPCSMLPDGDQLHISNFADHCGDGWRTWQPDPRKVIWECLRANVLEWQRSPIVTEYSQFSLTQYLRPGETADTYPRAEASLHLVFHPSQVPVASGKKDHDAVMADLVKLHGTRTRWNGHACWVGSTKVDRGTDGRVYITLKLIGGGGYSLPESGDMLDKVLRVCSWTGRPVESDTELPGTLERCTRQFESQLSYHNALSAMRRMAERRTIVE